MLKSSKLLSHQSPARSGRAGLSALVFLAGFALAAPASADTGTATQNVSVVLNSAGKVSVPAGFSLAATGTTFNAYLGALTVSYRFRTAPSGSGSITLRAGADFSPGGGPAISSGALLYTCGGAGLGTPCSGAQTVSTASSTGVVQIPGGVCTGGGGSCSVSDPATVQLQFTLDNSPQFQTGGYSSSLTVTVSTL